MEHAGRWSEGTEVLGPHDGQQRCGHLRYSQPRALCRFETGELHVLAISALLFIAGDVVTLATVVRGFHFEVPIGAKAEQQARRGNDRAGELEQRREGSECDPLAVPAA